MFEAGAQRRGDALIAAAVAVGLFVVYAWGACRTIYVGDSGELVTAVYVLGIPHPSGYPLYVLLGKLWTLALPFGSIAFRMSLFSAAAAAGACATLYVVARESGFMRPAALLGTGLLAFAPSWWLEANTQRVYALNALMLMLALRFAFAWWRARRDRDLVIAMLLAGIGATNHTFMALAGAAIALFAAIVDPSLFRRPRLVALCGAAFSAGLLVYLYLPIRARMSPVLDWGDPRTLRGVLDVVFRRAFWNRAWYESPRDLLTVAWDFLSSATVETGWIGVPLALLGLASVRRFRSLLFLPLAVAIADVAAMALHGSYHDIFIWHRYYIPGYAMVAFLAAAGAEVALERVGRVAAGALLVPLAMLAVGFPRNDRSQYRAAEDYSSKLLRSLPPGARLLAVDDNVLFVLLYMHYVENVRPDVDLVPQGIDQPKPNFAFDPDVDAVYFSHHPNWRVPGLEIVPVGLAYRAVRAGAPWPEPDVPPPIEGEADPWVPKDYLTAALYGQYHFMLGITFEQRDWPRARRELELAIAAAPEADVIAYNVGLLYRRNGFYDEAIDAFLRCATNNPRGLAPSSFGVGAAEPEKRRGGEMARETRIERDRVRSLEAAIAREPSFSGVRHDSVEFHRAMAVRLAENGETAAARGHFLRALSNFPK